MGLGSCDSGSFIALSTAFHHCSIYARASRDDISRIARSCLREFGIRLATATIA